MHWVSTPNGSAITNVSYNLNDGPFVYADTTDASFVITGLTNGSSYTVSIIAENVKGSSLPSAVSDAIVPLSAPEPPTVTSVIPGNSKVQIELIPGDANGSSVVGYKYSLDGTTYQWVKNNSSPISIYGLTNGTSYNISLQTVSESVGASNIVELPSPVIPYNSPDSIYFSRKWFCCNYICGWKFKWI